jgi:hypothetical protein
MTVGITASQLKLAGFDDETIIGHIEDQRPLLVQAGFSNNQIDKFYGIERTSPHPLHDSDLNTHNIPVNTESTTATNEQDVSTTWAEKRAKEDSATATNDTKVNNSNTKETTSPIKQGDTVNVDQSNIVTMVDQVIDNPDSIAFGKTPDYNEQLYKTIADQNAALAKTEAEMKANGLIYRDQLTDAERKVHARNGKKPIRDGVAMTVINRPTEDEKLPILNTVVTTGPSTMLVLNSLKNTQNLEDDDLATINEYLSFIAAMESSNRNIQNEAGTKGGVFQIKNDEIVELINYYGNIAKTANPEFVMPKFFEAAYEHKDATKLSLDAQRSLALVKILMNPDAQAYVLSGARGDKDALTELYTKYYNPAVTVDNSARIAEIEARRLEIEEAMKNIDVGIQDFSADTTGVINLDFENKSMDMFLNELDDLDAEMDLLTQGTRDQAAFNERVNQHMGSWNTLNYEYELPMLATWGSDILKPDEDDWAITKFMKDSWAGRKFVKYTGGAGDKNVFGAGYSMSTMGLIQAYHTAITEDGIDPQLAYEQIFMHQAQNFPQEIVQSAITLTADLPMMGLGFVTGAGTGIGLTAVTGGAAAPATPFIALGFSFGLPETVRDVYMRALLNGDVNNFDELLDEIMRVQSLKTFGKYTTVGAATYGTGKAIKSMGGNRYTQMAGEVGTLVTLSSVMEGQVPTRKDFAHAAVLIFGLHGAASGINKLYHVYKKYGVHPRNMETLSQRREDVKTDLLDPDIAEPRALAELNEAFITGLEEKAGIKIVEPSKVNPNQKVAIEPTGSKEGTVLNRQEVNGEVILEVKLDNGDVVHVKEIDVRVPMESVNEVVTVKKDGKIEITEKVEANFAEKQTKGEFNTDIVEVNARKTELAKNDNLTKVPEKIANDIRLASKTETVIKSNETIGTPDVFVNVKAMPDIANTIQTNLTKPKVQLKNTSEVITQNFKEVTKQDAITKVQEVFHVKQNGPSKVKVDSIVYRTNKGQNIVFPRSVVENLTTYKYTTKDGKIETGQTKFGVIDNILVVLEKDLQVYKGKILAAVRGEKATGALDHQANSYYRTHISKKDRVFPDTDNTFRTDERVYSSKGDDTWGVPNEPPPEMPVNASYKKLYNNAKGLDTFDLVELVEVLINKLPVTERMNKASLRGYFQYGKVVNGIPQKMSKQELTVAVNKALQENPKDFTMTLAHEIGHLIDYLPAETMKKGNILGSMAALKGYMNKWIDGKADGAKPLSQPEINALKKAAEKEAQVKEPKIDKEIKEDLAITPEKILDIFRDPDIRNKIDKEFYDAFVKLDGKLKKLITKSAMRGMIDPHIKSLVDRINGKKPTSEAEAKMGDQAAEIFKRKFEAEIRERGLVSRQEITQELVKLSALWKPFNRQADPNYTAYRDNPRELMADFMMAYLLRPKWTMLNAPKSWQLFNYHMYKRPEVKAQYEKVQNEINQGSDARYSSMVTRISNKFVDSKIKIFDGMERAWQPNKFDGIQLDFLDTMAWFYRRFGGQNGMWGKNKTGNSRWMDKETMNLNARMENYRYRHAGMQRYVETIDAQVIRPVEAAGYNSSMLSTMLLLRNLAVSQQRMGKANPMGLWAQIKAMGKEGEAIANEFIGERTPLQAYEFMAKEHPILDQAATKFYELRKTYVHPLIKESKAFDKETLDKIINNEEYITFNVLEFALKRLDRSGGANISSASFSKQTTGTMADIVDPLLATIQKDSLLMSELKRNRMIHDSILWMQKNKDWIETFDEGRMVKSGYVKYGTWKDVTVQKAKYIDKGKVEPAPAGMETIAFMLNGKYRYYHVNKFAATAFKRNPHEFVGAMTYMASANNFFRTIFTEYNPYFWVKNHFRDTGRSVRNLPKARYFDLVGGGKHSIVKYWFKSLKPTWKSIMGNRKGTELTNWMENQGFLISQMEGYRGKAGEAAIQEMFKKGILTPDQFVVEKMLQRMSPKEYATFYDKTMGRFFQAISDFAKFQERSHKVAGTMYLKDMIERGEISMSTQEMMLKIQSDVGSPSFLRTAKYHQVTNNLFIFSNAMKEGIRGDYVRLREDPLSVTSKFVAYNVAPKLIQKAMKYGIFGTALATFYAGVNDYDEQNYIVIPLGYTKSGKPIYFRIPQDESARVMNGFIGLVAEKAFGNGEIGVQNFMKALESDVMPSLNPIIPLIADTIEFASGGNPMDKFRGQYALDEDVWKAQNNKTKVEALKYMWNTYGGSSIYRLRSDDPTEIVDELEEILGIPLAGQLANVFIKVGEHPVKADIFKDFKLLDREKSRESLVFKDAMKKILSKDDTPLTEDEIKVIAKRSDYIKNNVMLRNMIGKVTGGTDLLQMLISEDDIKKKALIIKNISEFVQENPADFPLLFVEE